MSGQSKKQGEVSHSTPEAGLLSAEHAMRTYGAPALDLWSVLLQRQALGFNFHEGNETAFSVIRTGYSQALRPIQRTHGIDLRALHERFKQRALVPIGLPAKPAYVSRHLHERLR